MAATRKLWAWLCLLWITPLLGDQVVIPRELSSALPHELTEAVEVGDLSSVWSNVSAACIDSLKALKTPGNTKGYMLAAASGKDIPFDAGKHSACVHIKGGAYFLVHLEASSAWIGNGKDMKTELGLCLTDQCSTHDVHELITVAVHNPSKIPIIHIPFKIQLLLETVKYKQITVTSPKDKVEPKWDMIVALVVLGSLVMMSLVATVMTKSERKSTSALPGLQIQGLPANSLFVRTFSLSLNMKKLLAPSPQSAKATDNLSGLRVISMFHIILGHTFLMPGAISGYANPEEIVGDYGAEKNPLMVIVVGADMAVDTFFYLSGFLMAYLALQESKKLNWKKIVFATIYRWFRLTPSLAFGMLMYTCVFYYWGTGPFFPRWQESVHRRCKGTWWSELTYTMNFYPWDPDYTCMGWTWYLGNDFIFSIIGLCLVSIYQRGGGWKSAAYIAAGVISAGSIAQTLGYGVEKNVGAYVFDSSYTRYSYYTYSRPWNRIPAYLVGMAFAWILIAWRDKTVSNTLKDIAVLLASVCLLATLLLPYPNFKHPESWSALESNLYWTFSRPVWAAAIGIISVACIGITKSNRSVPVSTNRGTPKENGQNGNGTDSDSSHVDLLEHDDDEQDSWKGCVTRITNDFLSLYIWTPLARLTYGAYIVHPIIIKWLSGIARYYYTFEWMGLLERTIANIILAYMLSLCLFLLVERPAMTLTSSFLKK